MTKIENEQIIDLTGMSMEIRSLTCDICYCLLINPKKCSNRKCSKVFCSECIDSSIQIESCCPFCRLTVKDIDFIMCDPNLNFVLYNLKVICSHFECATKTFKTGAYIDHIKAQADENQCTQCLKNYTDTRKIKQCSNPSCRKLSCESCNLITFCSNCKQNLCDICGDINKHNKVIPYNKDENSITINSAFKCTDLIESQSELNKCQICKKIHKNVNCERLKHLCEMCLTKVNSVLQTNNMAFEETDLDCESCFPKCCYKNVLGVNPCSKCNKLSCDSAFCTNSCQLCKKTFCNDCFVLCQLCKTETCKDCCLSCDDCKFSHENSFCCMKCSQSIGMSMIKRCSYMQISQTNQTPHCQTKLCLNCWKVCNACSTVLCNKHSNKCSGCEEHCCDLHLYNCEFCEEINDLDENVSHPNKICMKKCAKKCELCNNISTSQCDKEAHPYVTDLNCGHNMCEKCGKRCGKCQNLKNKNGDIACSICENSKFIYCKFCKLEYCQSCSSYCDFCRQFFCSYDSCVNCNKRIFRCVNCLLMDSQIYCGDCNETFEVCDNCSNFLICSEFCYVEFANKQSHLCRMFNCEKCQNYKIDNKLITKQSSVSRSYSRNFSKPQRSVSLSLERFIEISEGEEMFLTPRRKRLTTEDDKVMTGCQDSCTCIIY